MSDDDRSVLARVKELSEEEHNLWRREATGPVGEASAEDRARLHAIELELDQCWDLLRQRRAHREFGQDPDASAVRDSGTIEGYRQ